jgi:hypothetical protein
MEMSIRQTWKGTTALALRQWCRYMAQGRRPAGVQGQRYRSAQSQRPRVLGRQRDRSIRGPIVVTPPEDVALRLIA